MNKTSFKEGNEHRYTPENRPIKTLTAKQQAAGLEALLVAPMSEVRRMAEDADSPAILYKAANYIVDGEEYKVFDLIQSYRDVNGYKRQYNKKKEP